MAPLTVLLMAALTAPPIQAQSDDGKRITIIPFMGAPGDSLLAGQLYRHFLGGIRTSASIKVVGEQEVSRSLESSRIADVMASTAAMDMYALSSGSAYVLGGVVRRLPDGGLDVAALVYGLDDHALRAVESRRYTDEAAAETDMADLARTISHPRNLTPSDTAFFYSLLLPGAGQASLGRWDHAALCLGLTASLIVYKQAIPTPDPFFIRGDDFVERYDYWERRYRYYVYRQEVSAEEFNEALSLAQEHARHAADERRSVERRQRLTTNLLVVSWLFNIVDTLILSRRKVDGRPFFTLVESLPGQPESTTLPSIGFHLHIKIR